MLRRSPPSALPQFLKTKAQTSNNLQETMTLEEFFRSLSHPHLKRTKPFTNSFQTPGRLLQRRRRVSERTKREFRWRVPKGEGGCTCKVGDGIITMLLLLLLLLLLNVDVT